jgi:hypothetical protein
MTLYEGLSLIVSAAGFIGLVITIRYLALQTQSSAQALESNTFGTSATATFMIDTIFIEHPDLRRYFYDMEEHIHPPEEAARIHAVAELMLDYFDYVLLQQQRSAQVHRHNFWSEQYLIDSFSASPILCEYLEQRKSWYSDGLTDFMRQGMERRKERLARGSIGASP